MKSNRPNIEGAFFFDDGVSMGMCPLDSARAQTVMVLVESDDFTVNFHINEDRHGYVDPELGEERYQKAIQAARLFVAAPALLKAAERMLQADVTTEEIEQARDDLEAAINEAKPPPTTQEVSMTDTKPIKAWMITRRPGEGPHERDTINGCCYGLVALDAEGKLSWADVWVEKIMRNYFDRENKDREKIRWSWGNAAVVCSVGVHAEEAYREALKDHPTIEFCGAMS